MAFVVLCAAPVREENVVGDIKSPGREITLILIEINKEDFLQNYAPKQDGLHEFSYGTNYDKLPAKNKKGVL